MKLNLKSIEQIKERFPNVEINDKYKQIFNMLENTDDMINVVGEAGSGKAQPLDIIIPTPKGNVRFGDLKVGDYVFDRKGKPTKVIGIFPRGKLDLYKVVLSDGRETYCNDDHLWSYYTSRGNLKTSSLREMMNKGIIKETFSKNDDRIRKNCRFKIPTHSFVEFDIHNKLPIDPYVIGAFIGNGCNLEKELSFSSDDEFTVKECARLLNFDYDKRSNKNYTWTFKYNEKHGNKFRPQTSDVFSEFKDELCVKSNFKRIPQIYKTSSKEERISLIQGLFDTDGCISKNEGRMNLTYSTTSINLANDIKEVLLSLGYVSIIHLYKRKDKNDCYTINVNIDDSEKHNFFRLPRKLEKIVCGDKNRKYNMVGIKEVIPMNKKVEMMCIKVDNDEELYLTSDYIVTHNTKLIEVLNYAIEDNTVICSSTGVASALLSASCEGVYATTIHSTFQIPPQTIYSTNKFKKVDLMHEELIRVMDCLIIDEMSMVNASLFDYLIGMIKYIRHGDLPRIILFGDILQLPPVIPNNDLSIKKYFNEMYKGNVFYFNSHCFNDLDFKTILLNKVYRQEGDEDFKDILNRIRIGKPTKDDLNKLNSRVVSADEELYWEIDHPTSLRIVTTNKSAEVYNDMRYETLEGEEYIFKANMTESFKLTDKYKSGLYPEELKLKIGASVMILRNDTENHLFVNGDMGTVISCNDEEGAKYVTVELNNGSVVEVHEIETQEFEYYVEHDGKESEVKAKAIASYKNIPLKLSYANTVHKCQGLSLNYGCFDKGNWLTNASVYVALSRFRKMEGFILTKPLTMQNIMIDNEAITFLNKVENENNSILDDVEVPNEIEEKIDEEIPISDDFILLTKEKSEQLYDKIKTLKLEDIDRVMNFINNL